MRTCSTLLVVLIAAGCSKGNDEPAKPLESPNTVAPEPPKPELPPHELYDSAGAAVEKILTTRPAVIGFGELHATTADHASIVPALPRFNAQILEPLSRHATDIVVETWPEFGTCGKAEQQVSKQVKQDTERPPETENHVLALARRARELGMVPHALEMSCDDYKSLLDDNKQVDYEKLLLLITDRLGAKTTAILGGKDRVVALYGGSTHNNLYPVESIADLSYAARVRDATGGKYVEVDLYVPEFAVGNELFAREPWYPLLEHAASTDKVVLFQRGEGSYILLLRKTK